MNYTLIFPRKLWELNTSYKCTKEELDNAELNTKGFIKTVGNVDYIITKR